MEKNEVIDRLNILRQDSGQTEKEFRKTLSEITGKTPRTLRRWYALETAIQDEDLKIIAKHFGQHEHWLKYGDRHQTRSMVDQIMASNHYGAVIMQDGKAVDMNYKFIEMMNLTPEKLDEAEACEYVLNLQPKEASSLCGISENMALQNGCHHHNMNMVLGDMQTHSIEVTTLNINNGRILRIFMDKGQILRT
ncbi:MAG: hypothetical protein OQL06_09160 [Gammaproteobacteria bacterium]|nr:hypothetical protein [Gammaproteobacteria bacterium]